MVEWLQHWTHDLKVLCNSGLKRALDLRPEGSEFRPCYVIRVWNPRPRSVNSQLQTQLRFHGIMVAISSSLLRWTVCFSSARLFLAYLSRSCSTAAVQPLLSSTEMLWLRSVSRCVAQRISLTQHDVHIRCSDGMFISYALLCKQKGKCLLPGMSSLATGQSCYWM